MENDAKEAVKVLLSLGAHTAKQDCHSRSAVHYGAENNPEMLKVCYLIVVLSSPLPVHIVLQ